MDRSADWMAQSHVDLQHARHDLEGGFYEWACFSAQQAADKAVKAVFQHMGIEAWGHSVTDLLDALQNSYPVPAAVRNAAADVDKAYIPTRYPDAHPTGAPSTRYVRVEAERMIQHADEIIRFCQGLLPGI
jgi:HEPN domain-containing protein